MDTAFRFSRDRPQGDDRSGLRRDGAASRGDLLGGKARDFRRYDGFGLDTLSDQALFIGPTAYFQLSDRSRLTASWSTHAWGRASGMPAGLDFREFERHQARLVFGVNF